MTNSRLWRGGMLVAALALIAGCSDQQPVAPSAQSGLFGTLTGLLTCDPLSYDSTTQLVGPQGGVILVGPHRLTIPAGALSDTVSITAVVRSEDVNEVRFQPEGLQFAQPAQLSMSYANCGLVPSLLPKRIAHTSDLLDILEYVTSVDNVLARRVTGSLEHFSGYAVAW